MKALTIRQPYADAIVHVDHPRWGRKRIENRTWKLPEAMVGVRFLIHAAKAGDRKAVLAGVQPGPDTRGAIIGSARLTGCHFAGAICGLRNCGPWGQLDTYHWELADVIALPEPVPAKGQLGFWEPAPWVRAAVEQQLAEHART